MDDRLLSYLYCFNVAQDYFLCHEYLESLWLDSGRPQVQQGLIQAAVCLYHLYNGNVRGALRMWSRAKPRLEAHGDEYEGIDLRALVTELDLVFHCIPDHLRDARCTPEDIACLELPAVRILLPEELERAVLVWSLPPVPET